MACRHSALTEPSKMFSGRATCRTIPCQLKQGKSSMSLSRTLHMLQGLIKQMGCCTEMTDARLHKTYQQCVKAATC